MGVRIDFSDVDQFFAEGYAEVIRREEEVGRDAVAYAQEVGNYHDVTGHLRASNYYKATKDGLEIGNSAEYASNVEARGRIVVTDAALYAERRMRE